jgi:hypothetical protein
MKVSFLNAQQEIPKFVDFISKWRDLSYFRSLDVQNFKSLIHMKQQIMYMEKQI